MKYLASSLLLLAVAAAAPLKDMHGHDLSDHSSAAAAFKKNFRTFVGRNDGDVDKFMDKAQKTTDGFIEAATVWKRDAQKATEEATAAITRAKRSIRLRKHIAEGDINAFIQCEQAGVEKAATHMESLHCAADDAFCARIAALISSDLSSSPSPFPSSLHHSADGVASEVEEVFATISYVQKLRANKESIEKVVEHDQKAAELATVQETRAKRGSYFADMDMKKRVKFFEREVKLREEFLGKAD
ncbi:hypothetical protein DOTSEDRAFT_56208 [Dothistroma septosporum NZE10]|uniref:Uncharacterized protein n=1 Tax=Dothistroma septosporum (strain NZE10 / CBS 128990) TaxID=675120 RepID=N1PC94_DOTSN|nr:hypothetical protein DOTSEDRAFT_56208 [Dothistroma septosporum NZE10]